MYWYIYMYMYYVLPNKLYSDYSKFNCYMDAIMFESP